jgi:hydrogenase maturation factor HypE
MTQFQQAQQAAKEGKLQVPTVSTSTGTINYFGYQISVHLYNLKMMSLGMKFREITFTQIKKYYGLKGKSAKECVVELQALVEEYKANLN